MKLLRKVGVTSEIWQVFITDSSSTTGAGLTGLTNASSGLTAYYSRDSVGTATSISLVSMTLGTFTSGGFKEVSSANLPGVYQFCPPNAALASGAKSCVFMLKGAANMVPLPIEVDLDGGLGATGLDLIPANSTFSQAVADAIWDDSTASHVSAGSFGEAVGATAAIVTVLDPNGLNTLTADYVAGTFIAGLSGTLGDSRIANLDAAISTRSTLTAGNVWDLALSGHTTPGTTGAALNAAGTAGDPWTTALPGAYASGTAGNILGNNLSVPLSTVSTRVLLALPAVAPNANGGLPILSVAGTTLAYTVSTVTTTGTATALSVAERNAIADALLTRNITGGSSSGRTVKQAFAAQRNKVAFDVPTAGEFTVFDIDDSTPLWTGTYTSSASASPVTQLDPA